MSNTEWQTSTHTIESTWTEYAPNPRGRWVVIVAGGKGYRCRRLSRARALAKIHKGTVRHYDARKWGPAKPIAVSTIVFRWNKPETAIALDIPVLP